jgi:anti-sigma28 factor (negative regulator of flagellin synthesis)
MRISDTEYTKVLQMEQDGELPISNIEATATPLQTDDAELVARIVEELEAEPDVREEMVADLKARIDAGTYKVTDEAIADLIIRRSKADNIR